MLSLLRFFPITHKLVCDMHVVGARELAGLAQAGSFACKLKEVWAKRHSLAPSFFTPGLWAMLPALRTLHVTPYGDLRVPVGDILQCLAAAPHPVRIKGLQLDGQVKGA